MDLSGNVAKKIPILRLFSLEQTKTKR